jgi:hypothetical protein
MPSYSGVWTLTAQYQAKAGLQWPQAPGAPTSVSAVAGDAQATVTFVAPSFAGIPAGITGYLATSSPGGFTATGASSPLTVTGLSNGTSYTFGVQATNSIGYGPAGTSGSVSPAAPIAVFSGGYSPSAGDFVNVMDYVTIATTGNATDFGDLVSVSSDNAACASSTRGVIKAGNAGSSALNYITFASVGNASSFGSLTNPVGSLASANSSTRGLFGGGAINGSTRTSVIAYITIATTGNALSFGNLNTELVFLAACSSSTRCVWAGGSNASGTRQDGMYFTTIATLGNVSYFGGLSTNTSQLAGCSNATRGIFAGGEDNVGYLNTMRYITIASTGNTTNFGNLAANNNFLAAGTNTTRAIFGGGQPASSNTGAVNTMQYVTIATTGNTTDFGDLTTSRSDLAGCSSANGGTQ